MTRRHKDYAYLVPLVEGEGEVFLKTIIISSKDLETLQKRALEEDIPYQTLLASILHKYAAGRPVERDA